jgi:hypothetical protein
MKRLQGKMRKEKERREKSNRRLAPNYNQRLQALKMEGEATFKHPKDMPKDSPNYQRWMRDRVALRWRAWDEDWGDWHKWKDGSSLPSEVRTLKPDDEGFYWGHYFRYEVVWQDAPVDEDPS